MLLRARNPVHKEEQHQNSLAKFEMLSPETLQPKSSDPKP